MKVKLVRDKLESVLMEQKRDIFRLEVGSHRHIALLASKLSEETNEALKEISQYWNKPTDSNKDKLIEELADVLTVIKGICKMLGVSESEFIASYNKNCPKGEK